MKEGDGARVRRALLVEQQLGAAEVEQPRTEHHDADGVEDNRDPRERLRVLELVRGASDREVLAG